jgi:hypothetical protein
LDSGLENQLCNSGSWIGNGSRCGLLFADVFFANSFFLLTTVHALGLTAFFLETSNQKLETFLQNVIRTHFDT